MKKKKGKMGANYIRRTSCLLRRSSHIWLKKDRAYGLRRIFTFGVPISQSFGVPLVYEKEKERKKWRKEGLVQVFQEIKFRKFSNILLWLCVC